MTRRFGGLVAVLLMGVASACDQVAPDLAEWTPDDHDNQVITRQRRRPGKARTHRPPSKTNPLIDITWMKECSNCHGKRGRGDGPQSAMFKARDLTSSEWQASVSDDAIAKVIREGRDKMPAFNLPDSTVQGLVEHIREFARRGRDNRDRADDDEEAEEAEETEETAEASEEEPSTTAPASASPGSAATPASAPASSPPAASR